MKWNVNSCKVISYPDQLVLSALCTMWPGLTEFLWELEKETSFRVCDVVLASINWTSCFDWSLVAAATLSLVETDQVSHPKSQGRYSYWTPQNRHFPCLWLVSCLLCRIWLVETEKSENRHHGRSWRVLDDEVGPEYRVWGAMLIFTGLWLVNCQKSGAFIGWCILRPTTGWSGSEPVEFCRKEQVVTMWSRSL